MRVCCFFLLLAVAGLAASRAHANTPAEPKFPPTCIVLTAGDADQLPLQSALDQCNPGEAVELTPGGGPDDDSFTIDPIIIPAGVSLIVDGGVTVYGTTEAAAYQTDPPAGIEKKNWVCGKVDFYAKSDDIPCKPLITMSSNSGIYGYGIIDGQGGAQIQQEYGANGPSWWDLIDLKLRDACSKATPPPNQPPGASCLEGSPHMITMGSDTAPEANDVLYKITLRNPPMEAVTIKGSGGSIWSATLWGVKIQAPWNRGNTGALNLAGSNMLVQDNVLSVGDQDIAMEGSVGDTTEVTSNIDIEGLRLYSRAGVALLDAGNGFSNITVNDFAMTGDVPSFVPPNGSDGGSVNGVSAADIKKQYGISIYSALPGGLGDTYGLQLFTGSLDAGKAHTAENVTFQNACITDVATPVNVEVAQPGAGTSGTEGGTNPGQIGPVYFNNIHVLSPGPQFVQLNRSGGTITWGPRQYAFEMTGNTVNNNPNQITLNNFVYGDGETALALFGSMEAANNIFTTRTNVYPSIFNSMISTSDYGSIWTFSNNSYNSPPAPTLPKLGYHCPASLFPFLNGELYVDLHGENSGKNANLRNAKVVQSSLVTLNAIVQPAMSQAELYIKDYKDKSSSTLAVPSPALNGLVSFYDNGAFIGTAPLGGNGTIASFRINSIGGGTHVFTAEYVDPQNAIFYRPFAFGRVKVTAAVPVSD